MYADTGMPKNVYHTKEPLLAMKKPYTIGNTIQQRTAVDYKN